MSRTTDERVRTCLSKFIEACGAEAPALAPDTDLLKDLGLSSDQGVEFVLDLCEEFDFDFPKDFNPLVHVSGKRGRKFRELIADIDTMTLNSEEKR